MTYKKLTTKGKLRWWKRRLKIRENRLKRSRKKRTSLRSLIRRADRRIAKLQKELAYISDDGVSFVASFEGFPNDGRPYNDPVGHCTIGYGHLLHRGNCTNGDHKKWGQLSKAEALDLLREDLDFFAEGVKTLTPSWKTLKQNERDALISFAFNVGLGAYGSSTLLKKLNIGRKKEAADEFLKWVYADGQRLPGLERRRQAERKIFLEGH